MTTTASNTSVRERRRRSHPLAIEQMDILKALTAAEYSRRQFILNYASIIDTKLLVPGKKADIIKAAEEFVVKWMNQNGYGAISNNHFKFAVDERLWEDLVGADVPFPFAFMRTGIPDVVVSPEGTTATIEEEEIVNGQVQDGKADVAKKRRRSKSEAFLPEAISAPAMTTVEVRLLEDGQAQITTVATNGTANGKAAGGGGNLSRQTTNSSTNGSNNLNGTQSSSSGGAASNTATTTMQSAAPQEGRRMSSLMNGLTGGSNAAKKERERKKSLSQSSSGATQNGGSPTIPESTQAKKPPADRATPLPTIQKKRSMSLTSLETDDLKMGRRTNTAAQEKFPFLVRWSRSWGRRTSA
ncbi:hypothetical protein V8F06_009458 [Rhypophila decipiens]